ncbi:substrate-binding periplasmic protein [Colwelliaceae bacterium 6441]
MRYFLSALLFLPLLSYVKAQELYFPGDDNQGYIVTLLEHVLTYSPDKNYQLKFYNQNVPKVRVFEMIANNQGIDIVAAGATNERELKLRPIRFPILKGLNGWRISFVTQDNKNIFAKKMPHKAFNTLKVGQLHSWSDSKILESNGINVQKASSYQGLFNMLEKGRFDLFPRSIIEVDWELEKNKHRNIAKEPHIIIHYPTAYYFFVSKENESLARDIEKGLEMALTDGSFDKLFDHYYGDIVDKVRAEKRIVYNLHNPFLPEKTPRNRAKLWVDLGR